MKLYVKSLDDATFFLLNAEKALHRARKNAPDDLAETGSGRASEHCRRLRSVILRELGRGRSPA